MERSEEKEAIRKGIWRNLEQSRVSRFPRPIEGRIPNFLGAERAAQNLTGVPEFQRALAVKVNPDAPQTHVRKMVLSQGKLLIMPTPRLRRGFLAIDPASIPRSVVPRASTIRGAFTYGRPISVEELPTIDLVVAGSVAVSRSGARVGKGGGFSEIEYGILRELGLLTEETPIATTVHDLQVVDEAPVEDHDFLVDIIATPSEVIRVDRGRRQPLGILWEKVTPRMLEVMPILQEVKKKRG
ncbi:MAG: 5-formyltetrahydrofolate cyclo-ligase [Candidatus Geothermarchaeales archaeon]